MNQMDCRCKQISAVSVVICIAVIAVFCNSMGGFGVTLLLIGMSMAAMGYSLYSCFTSDILGNMQSKRRRKGQFKNVLLLRRQMNLVMIVFSLVCAFALFFSAEKIASEFLKVSLSVSALKMVCPLFVIMALQASVLAFFKGNGQYMPCLIGAILRPIGYFFIGSINVKKQAAYGEKVAKLLGSPEKAAIYTVNAVILGIVITEAVLFIIFFALYFGSNTGRDRSKSNAGTKLTEGTLDMVRNYLSVALYPIVGILLFVLPSFFGMMKLLDGATVQKVSDIGNHLFGAFSIILSITVVMVAKASMLGLKIVGFKKHQDLRKVKRSLEVTSYFSVRIGIFLCIIGMVLAKFFINAFYLFVDEINQGFFYVIMLSVLPICVSVVSLEIMKIQGKRGLGLLMLVITFIVSCVVMNLLPNSGENGIMGFAVAYTVSAYFLMALSLGFVLLQQYFQVNFSYFVIMPFIAGAITGIVMIIILKLISPHVGEGVSFVVGLVLGVMVYFGILSATKNVTSQDISFLYDKKTQKILGLFIK